MARMGVVIGAAALALFVSASARAQDSTLSAQANQAFLAANAEKPGSHVRPSGLQYRIVKNGFGKTPHAADTVEGKRVVQHYMNLHYRHDAGITEGRRMPDVDAQMEIMRSLEEKLFGQAETG